MQTTLSLFGALGVRVGPRPVQIRGDIPRALVARLGMSPRQHVTAETLIDAVWQTPTPSVVSSLRSHLSRLRAEALSGVLRSDRQGYLLDLDPGQIDLWRFRSALDAAADTARDEAELADLLAGAIELSRSRICDDLPDLPFVLALRERVDDERRSAVETLAELRLARGEYAQAATELAELVRRSPLQERPARLLATALARSGRTTEALAAIDALADRLVDEQGLDLPARIAELRQGIVRQDPAVIVPGRSGETAIVRSGIPIPLTRFVGRRAERLAIESARASTRLITLVGPGGVGKTRLAVEAARQSTTALDDEQWMVDLTVVGSPDRVLGVVADTVGALGHSVEAIATRLGGRRVLLIADNAEHVIGAVATLVMALLERAADLTVLATSREAMRLPGERVIRVEPLTGPSAPDAVQIFLDRAADSSGDADLELTAPLMIDNVCRLLDGVPLALELAASRLDVLSIGELEASITAERGLDGDGASVFDPDRLLGSPAAGRHSSVADAIAWSYRLLTDDERDLLRQLGRFAGTFSLAAVRAICLVPDATELTVALAQKSLVSVAQGDTGRRRYRLLESVAAFARRLDAASGAGDDERAAWNRRHADYMIDAVETLAPALRSADARSAIVSIEAVWPDLQRALAFTEATDDRVRALRLVGALAHFWFLRGMLVEGRRSIERALALTGSAPDSLEANTLMGGALLAYQTGEADAAIRYIGEMFERAGAAGDHGMQALALAQFAYGKSIFGEPDVAGQLMEQAAQLGRAAEPWMQSEILMCRGQTLRALQRTDEALVALNDSHRIAREVNYAWMLASSAYVAGKVLIDQRRAREAIDLLHYGSAQAWALEDFTSALALAHAIGGAAALVERHQEGARIFGAVDRLGERYSYSPVVAEGEDAAAYRERVAIGLTAAEYDSAYAAGRRLDFAALFRLIEELPATPYAIAGR